jgi:hypothetical protein
MELSNGSYNTAMGYNALGDNDDDANVAIGYQAMDTATGADSCVAIGTEALRSTTGDDNIAIGRYAMNTAGTGGQNTVVGYQAGKVITSGSSNVIMGQRAGLDLTTGSTNTFVGPRAGQNITTASNNTAVGVDALEDATTAADNTCIGTNAGANLTSGSNNLLLGKEAGKSGSPGGQFTSHSNRVVLGNGNIQELNCEVALSVASDERDKTDFTDLDIGLDFVKQMKPYTYKWDKRHKYVDWDTNPDTNLNDIITDGTHKEAKLDIGFKAQDIEILEKAAGYDKDNKTNLTIDLSEDGKQYSMKYEKLVPILVKAIQELEEKVRVLENK